MIAVEGLRHAYEGHTVVELASWSVARGATGLVLGASGSGKSTLLHILAGLLTPSAGRVLIDGQDLSALRGRARDQFRADRIGVVFQNLHLVPVVSVAANVELAARLAGRSQADARDRARALLDRLGLSHRAHAKPRALSRGEAQRAAIARALAARPQLLLADEPTSALDDANAATVVEMLRDAAAQDGASMVIATHDQRLRDAFADRLELPGPARDASS